RRRRARARGRRRLPRAGDPHRLLLVSDARDRAEREAVPPARARLREPRRAAHGAGVALRLRRGSRLRGGDHRPHDGPRLPQVGGGEITIVNKTVPMALERLGYAPREIEEVVAWVDERNGVVGAPYVKTEHYPIFDCAVGERAIHYLGHVRMMGAVQPFISGAISKTVNMPEEATIEDVMDLYVDAWKLGVKAIAIYRDNCKVAQPLSSSGKDGQAAPPPVLVHERKRLP